MARNPRLPNSDHGYCACSTICSTPEIKLEGESSLLEIGHIDRGMIFNHYRQLVKPHDAQQYWSLLAATIEKIIPLDAHA